MQLENSKTAIVIITYNCHQIFLKQIERIKRHCKDDYQIIIVDNSTNLKAIDHIQYHAKNQGCNYIKCNASSTNGSGSHAFAANLSYVMFKNEYSHFFYLDMDCFPVKDFSAIEILGEKQFAGIGQEKNNITYIWPGAFIMEKSENVDFSPNHELGLDTGGNLYKIITKENTVFFNEYYEENPEFTKNRYNFYTMIHDSTFMHFIGSSNWHGKDKNNERINSLINILDKK